jgi:thiosulfate/3-mercaptopyruvate sulfurtransferase
VGPLIGVDSLAERLDGVVVIDARWRLGGPSTYPDFLTGHVPGAVWADLDTVFAGPPGAGGRHPLPDPFALQEALRRLGVCDDTPVIVYDAAESTAAARAWWVLRWAGLRDVRVLDGGLAAWIAAGRALQTGSAMPRTGDVTVRAGGMSAIGATGAAEVARTGILIDARIPARYRGEFEPVDPVAGHIPGARNLPAETSIARDGRFLPATELRQRFAAAGVSADAPVGAYCGSGVTAAHTVLALEIAGLSAALYPGSWSEWITDPGRPVATGGEPPGATGGPDMAPGPIRDPASSPGRGTDQSR